MIQPDASRDSARPGNDRPPSGPPLRERVLYVPRMSFGAARCFSAAIRSLGIETRPYPPSDARTLELGGRFTSGEECFPQRITLGDALKVIMSPGARPEKVAFFMPGAPGPCRFGQYAPFLRKVLDSIGAHDAMIVAPSSSSGYDEIGSGGRGLQRAAWRGLVCADVLRKALLRIRPYEKDAGETDAIYQDSITAVCSILEKPGRSAGQTLADLRAETRRAAERFSSVPRSSDERLRIGVVGEIFCRMNTFSNEEMIRKLEAHGAEAWISDIGEWVYYTNLEQRRKWIPYAGKRWSATMLSAYVKEAFQRHDEHAIAEPFAGLFTGREEPHRISQITDLAEPYLPAEGVYGEMVMNIGKAAYYWSKGCDGVVDISPFTCMNGIVSESIYPKVSRDHDGIPIRIFYFDGTSSHIDRDLGIFLELARTYRKRKRRS